MVKYALKQWPALDLILPGEATDVLILQQSKPGVGGGKLFVDHHAFKGHSKDLAVHSCVECDLNLKTKHSLRRHITKKT